MKRAAKKERAKLKQMAKAIRASAPPLPKMPKSKTDAPPKPRKAKRQPVVIGAKELESAREGLSAIARNGMTAAFAVSCLSSALLDEDDARTDRDRMRLLRVAAVMTEDRLMRTVCLMFLVRLLRQEFPAHQHDSKRLRFVVNQSLSLLKDAQAAAGWTNDPTISDWVAVTKEAVQAVADELPADPDAEAAEEPEVDPDADASPSSTEL